MKKVTAAIAVLFLFVILLIPAGVLAEMKPGAITISPHVGGYIFDSGQVLKNGPVYGLGLGYNFTKSVGAEGIFNSISSRSKSNTNNSLQSYLYRLDGLYHFMPDSQFVPYISAGLGAIEIDNEARGNDTDAIFDYGAGFKYFLTEALVFRSDVRHILVFDDSRNNFMYTFGLSYVFGGKTKEVTASAPAPAPTPAPAPAPAPKDSDGDGVYDSMDQCPGTPKGVAVDKNGCPKDSDKDGVPDYLDKCPDTPEGIAVDNKGCPVPIKEKVSIELKVEFDFDKAEIRSVYEDHLKKVANFLKAYPEAQAVVEGHTDSIGEEQYNIKLSQKRAENVRQYLIDKFSADPSRLQAKGFGESQPVADNKTKEGRQRNRRVVGVISATSEK